MTFDHDWWFGDGYNQQLERARACCTSIKYPEYAKGPANPDSAESRYQSELETRSVVYLRDGFSYEIKQLLNPGSTAFLSFECVATDSSYKVGAFVVSVPFEEICRVETFAVHPSERPEEAPTIKGFGGSRPPSAARGEDRPVRHDTQDREEGVDEDEDDEA